MYLGGIICEDGGSNKEVLRRVRAAVNQRWRVEGIMWDIKLTK